MKRDLWLRLHRYDFGHLVPEHLTDHVRATFGHTNASTHAFASKLSRKLGWTHSFALRAIEEYKRFIYLGLTGDQPVTPPKVIDQVWHEHLLFTRGYREFTDSVLEQPFEHNPELVPVETQTEAFREQYFVTLDRYADEFHREPPPEIWGTAKFGGRALKSSRTRTRQPDVEVVATDGGGEGPLWTYFSSDSSDGGVTAADAGFDFGGGGGFAGGGGGSDFGDSSSSDSSSGDSGSSGCSSCSSSCGGGCSS